MRRTIERPKEAITKVKHGRLEMKDVFIILGSAMVGWMSKFLVPPVLEIGYVLAYPISLYLLLSPSEVPQKKNIQVAFQVLLKDRTTYHSMLPPKAEYHETE